VMTSATLSNAVNLVLVRRGGTRTVRRLLGARGLPALAQPAHWGEESATELPGNEDGFEFRGLDFSPAARPGVLANLDHGRLASVLSVAP
jgi:hypothetical protein